MTTATLQKTHRREAREGYVRYILSRAGLSEKDVEVYLTTPQASLDDKSLLELIYTGDYKTAVREVESFTDEPVEKE